MVMAGAVRAVVMVVRIAVRMVALVLGGVSEAGMPVMVRDRLGQIRTSGHGG